MTDTNTLIEQLAGRGKPVQRLTSPLRRTLAWIGLATAIVAAVVAVYGFRPGLAQTLATPAAAIEWGASVLTGLLAAYATFQISVPGRSAHWAWLPLPTLLLWLGGIGLGCVGDFARMGMQAFAFQGESRECALAITLISLPLGLLMLMMVRHAAVVRPGPTAMLGVLSAAALAAAGVSLFHEGETALMVLVWHVGAVATMSLLSWAFSRRLFGWIGYGRQ